MCEDSFFFLSGGEGGELGVSERHSTSYKVTRDIFD